MFTNIGLLISAAMNFIFAYLLVQINSNREDAGWVYKVLIILNIMFGIINLSHVKL